MPSCVLFLTSVLPEPSDVPGWSDCVCHWLEMGLEMGAPPASVSWACAHRFAQACTSARGSLITTACHLTVTLSKNLEVCAVGTSLKTRLPSSRLPPPPPGHFSFHHFIGFSVSHLTCCMAIITQADHKSLILTFATDTQVCRQVRFYLHP